ncbi:uncharacterized protein [Rutidosis leptorrhynchoides]|uniref:uncharacterized protein isoform X2 n=1 Tax=Rutidosis leptorrhynchoides TaxID=125765 RepID=UPI003A99CB3A
MMCDTISPEGFPTHYFCFASFNQLQARSDNRSSILIGTNGKINFLRVSVRRQGETWFVSPREERTSHNEFNLLRSVWILLNTSLCKRLLLRQFPGQLHQHALSLLRLTLQVAAIWCKSRRRVFWLIHSNLHAISVQHEEPNIPTTVADY